MTRPGKGGERPKGGELRDANRRQPQADHRPLPVLSSPSYLLEMGIRFQCFHTSTSPSLQPLSHPSPYLRQRRHAEGRKEVSAKWAATSERASERAGGRDRANAHAHAHSADSGGTGRPSGPPANTPSWPTEDEAASDRQLTLANGEARSVRAPFKKSHRGREVPPP